MCKRKCNYKNRQYIICYTDGDEKGSKIEFSHLTKELLSSGINLIVIAIGFDQENINSNFIFKLS